MANEIKLPTASELQAKFGKFIPKIRHHLEINLVPDIKNDMIKALKLRNLTIFACIVVAIGSVAVSLFFATIAGGQQAIVDSKKTTIANLSEKVDSYSDLGKFLTIKNQLSGLSEIADNKNMLSRLFNVLSALMPKGNDSIKISELTVNLGSSPATIAFDAQANAGDPPYIDYRVLDAFKKSMQYMRYDYGQYVDKYGNTIPAYCMIESAVDGSNFQDGDKGIYAFWLITGEGCNPDFVAEEDEEGNVTNASDITKGYNDVLETYNNQTVVRIWRTPQFNEWYQERQPAEGPYIDTDGYINNVPHFESDCISYRGIYNYQNTGNSSETVYATTDNITWVGTNSSCMLVSSTGEGDDGISISDSSNGRDANNELVLRFSATINLNSEVFSFNNKHMIAIGPSSRYNVTDSFVQIQDMFSKRASDCLPGDTTCNNNQTNQKGNS